MEFVSAQTTAGACLLLALLAALLVFNLGDRDWYLELRSLELGLFADSWRASSSLLSLTNDGLISLFFFLIGLEIKRELMAGELQEASRRRMLLATAAGGMLVPALIYAGFNLWSAAGAVMGWGIPMATDTALAIGVLAALGKRLAPGAAALLVGLAIVDDIGAVAVITLFYSQTVNLEALFAALGLLSLSVFANYAGIRHPLIYAGIGVLVWYAVHHSGVHASVAGVLVAATVPARPRIHPGWLQQRLRRRVEKIQPEADVLADTQQHDHIESLATTARAATTPLRRWERSLDLPVALLVLPLFAFLNAGVSLNPALLLQAAFDPVALGITLGLAVGKPLGIVAAARLAVWSGFGRLPPAIDSWHLLGLGLLAGIGFTMSTFIASLALPEARLEMAKIAILSASLVAGVLGYSALRFHRAG